MKTQEIKVRDKNYKYSILIGKNSLNLLPKKIKAVCPKTKKITLIIDSKISSKFRRKIKTKLKNYELLIILFNSNEKNKSIEKVKFFLKKCFQKI